MTTDDALRRARQELVLRHVQAENERDLDAVMATFTHPRYEIVPTGMVHDGDAAVRQMLRDQWDAMPPLHFAAEGLFHGDDGVMVETRTTGVNAAGAAIDMLSVNLFGFDGEALVLERCWFDRMTVAAALGHTPTER